MMPPPPEGGAAAHALRGRKRGAGGERGEVGGGRVIYKKKGDMRVVWGVGLGWFFLGLGGGGGGGGGVWGGGGGGGAPGRKPPRAARPPPRLARPRVDFAIERNDAAERGGRVGRERLA